MVGGATGPARCAGWWIACAHFAAVSRAPLHVVFDVQHPDLPEGDHDGVVVHYATRRGRDAADERILELLDAGFDEPVEVVTSDRDLADGCRARGHPWSGPAGSWTGSPRRAADEARLSLEERAHSAESVEDVGGRVERAFPGPVRDRRRLR